MLKIAEKHVFQQFFLLKKNTVGFYSTVGHKVPTPEISAANLGYELPLI